MANVYSRIRGRHQLATFSAHILPIFLVCAVGIYASGCASSGPVKEWVGYNPSTTLTSPNVERGGQFGDAVAGVPDIDGDGVRDLLVGAPGEENVDIDIEGARRSTLPAGRVYAFSGEDGSLLRTIESPPHGEKTWFGSEVTGLGDVNGDGAGDFVVGAKGRSAGDSSFVGRAYIMSGADGSLLHTLTSPTQGAVSSFGYTVAGIGDVTGDGVEDVGIGSGEAVNNTTGAGRVHLFDGKNGQLVRSIGSPNPEESGRFGTTLSSVGDVNGDRVPDLAVGASGETADSLEGAGRVYLFSGADGRRIRTLHSPDSEEDGRFGWATASVGDVTGDGSADVVVGAPGEGGLAVVGATGRAYLFGGSEGRLVHRVESPHLSGKAGFGSSVAGTGDVDGDGANDFAVGTGGRDLMDRAGKAYLFSGVDISGADRRLLQKTSSPNVEEYGSIVPDDLDLDSSFGSAIARIGDADGDGAADVAVGASTETVGGEEEAGRVYVFRRASGAGSSGS